MTGNYATQMTAIGRPAARNVGARPSRIAVGTLACVAVASLVGLAFAASSQAAVGDIAFAECIADEGQSGCFDPALDSLGGADDVEVSPDGSSIYVASFEDDSLTHFSRNAAGQIFFQGCIADEGKSGCFDTGTDPLDGATGVEVSPDGTSVYVASLDDDSLTHYSRNAAGRLTFQGCIADGGGSGCFDPAIDPLGGADDVEVSPDGSSVYVGSSGDDSLIRFSREAAPETTITKKPKRTTTKHKATFRFVSEPAAGATFECKLDRKPFRPCSSPYRKRVKPGRHSFRVRATVAGLTDPTPARARWRVTR